MGQNLHFKRPSHIITYTVGIFHQWFSTATASGMVTGIANSFCDTIILTDTTLFSVWYFQCSLLFEICLAKVAVWCHFCSVCVLVWSHYNRSIMYATCSFKLRIWPTIRHLESYSVISGIEYSEFVEFLFLKEGRAKLKTALNNHRPILPLQVPPPTQFTNQHPLSELPDHVTLWLGSANRLASHRWRH